MQKITPFLWFNANMNDVLNFYKSVFPDATSAKDGELADTPSGHTEMATIKIYDLDFSIMTSGPYLPFNPTVSFIVSCGGVAEVDDLWSKLSKEGKILMELSNYPFAEKFGWVEDKYGVSWQIMFSSTMETTQKVTPTMMFAGNVVGRAEEAVNFYTSTFKNSKINYVTEYTESDPKNEPKAKVKHAGITIENLNISLMDSGMTSPLNFEQAISFIVNCDTQEEIDYYWEKLTADGGKEIQCGWLNDKFGFPWQIVLTAMGKMMSCGDKEKIARVTEAFMKMKKFDIKTLEDAFNG